MVLNTNPPARRCWRSEPNTPKKERATLQRLLHPCEVVHLLPEPAQVPHAQQPPARLDRVVDAPAALHAVPALVVEEALQLVRLDVLGVRMCSGRDESKHIFGERDGKELGERGSGDGRDEEEAAGLDGQQESTPIRSLTSSDMRVTFVKFPRQLRKPFGSSTCSSTSIAHTTSNCLPSSTRFSAAQCLYSREFFFAIRDVDCVERVGNGESATANEGSRAACVCATEMLIGAASIASVLAPRRERA